MRPPSGIWRWSWAPSARSAPFAARCACRRRSRSPSPRRRRGRTPRCCASTRRWCSRSRARRSRWICARHDRAPPRSAWSGAPRSTWDAAPGTSLLTSILVRPRGTPERWGGYSLVSALAVADALARAASLSARLKWPNDVLVGDRKIAGILLESRMPAAGVAGPAGGPGVIAVGIGINLGQREFPASLAARATSVLRETERIVDRDAMLTALLEAFDGWRACLERDGLPPI